MLVGCWFVFVGLWLVVGRSVVVVCRSQMKCTAAAGRPSWRP